MKRRTSVSFCTIALVVKLTGLVPSAHAADVFFNQSTGDFNTSGNWSDSAVPDSSDVAIIGSGTQNPATATYGTDTRTVSGLEIGDAQKNGFASTTGTFTMSSGTLNIGYNHTGRFGGTGTINISDGSIIQSTGFGGQWGDGTGSVGNLTISGGLVDLTGTHRFGSGGTSNVTVSNGSWTTQGITVGQFNPGNANFTIMGDSSTVSFGSSGFTSTSGTNAWTLDFASSGITEVTSSGAITFGAADTLTIDLQGYTGPSAVTLFSSTTGITGTFDTVVFNSGGAGTLDYSSGNSVVLNITAVPEPSSLMLMMGTMVLGITIMLRRRK